MRSFFEAMGLSRFDFSRYGDIVLKQRWVDGKWKEIQHARMEMSPFLVQLEAAVDNIMQTLNLYLIRKLNSRSE